MCKIGVFGPQGSGKTTIAMFMARMFQERDARIKIYTNINTTNDDTTVITINDLADIPFTDNLPKIVVVDEAYFSVGSRSSNSKQNMIWTKAHALFRKSDIIATFFVTHRPNMIDVNIRNLLEYVIMGRKNNTHFDYLLYQVISKEYSPLIMPKTKALFDYTRFNTKDFPNPIEVDKLSNHPLFKIAK